VILIGSWTIFSFEFERFKVEKIFSYIFVYFFRSIQVFNFWKEDFKPNWFAVFSFKLHILIKAMYLFLVIQKKNKKPLKFSSYVCKFIKNSNYCSRVIKERVNFAIRKIINRINVNNFVFVHLVALLLTK